MANSIAEERKQGKRQNFLALFGKPCILVQEAMKKNIWNYLNLLVPIVVLFGILNIEAISFPRFIRLMTFMIFQNAYLFPLAMGMVLVLLVHEIDLSTFTSVWLTGALSFVFYNMSSNLPVSLLLTLLCGLCIGIFHGYLVAYIKMPSILVTFSSLLLFRGIYFIVRNLPISYEEKYFDDIFHVLSTGIAEEIFNIEPLAIGDLHLYPIPIIFAILLLGIIYTLLIHNRKKSTNKIWFIGQFAGIAILTVFFSYCLAWFRGFPIVILVLCITAFIFYAVIKYTTLGRNIYAIGANPGSVKLSGINTELSVFMVFCIMGLLTGLSGFICYGYTFGTMPATPGPLIDTDTITACYIGGASVSGGVGTIAGALAGWLAVAFLDAGMNLANMGGHYQYVIKALVLLFVVFVTTRAHQKA
jgi:putative multiple sugar transport system permease protein